VNTLADIDFTAVTPGTLILIALATGIAGVAAWFLSKSMIRAAEFPDPQPLIIALGILTLVALLGALVTGKSDAYTLAATGMGAIAGAVTATWGGGKRNDDEEQS
jgi:hypothetical protein